MIGKLRAMMALMALAGAAAAQPLDEVALEYQSAGIVATIRLTTPVRYVQHTPPARGKTLEIFYERAPGATLDEKWVDGEVVSSPPTTLIPAFTVTTRDQASKPRLVVEFAREAEFAVSAAPDGRSFIVVIQPDKRPISAASAALPLLPELRPEPVLPPEASEDAKVQHALHLQARQLMAQGREALAANDAAGAVAAFNQLLLLLPNDYSEDAQEWVGVARERAGELDKAKQEYELYLKLYPANANTPRVQQRLSGLGATQTTSVLGGETRKQEARFVQFGSVGARYYFGRSTIDTTSFFNNAQTVDSLSFTDQSALITSFDWSGRYTTEDYDSRVVVRDTLTADSARNRGSDNRLYAAYAEFKQRKLDYALRVGRQSASGGGVQGRFDGVWASYGAPEEVRSNLVVGRIAEFVSVAKPVFLGVSYDIGPVSAYFINQKVDGSLDRRALGGEWRYFEGGHSAYATLDYDFLFHALNTAMVMGTLEVASGTKVNLLLDRRRSPSLSVRNALLGAQTSSVSVLQAALGSANLRDLALARTTTTSGVQLGANQQLGDTWQVGADLRLSSTAALAPSGAANTVQGFYAGIPASGLDKTLSGNLTGNGLLKAGDLWTLGGNLSKSDTRTAHALFLFNHTQLDDKLGVDGSWQFSTQDDVVSGRMLRNAPSARVSYRMRDTLFLDADGGLEWIRTGAGVSSTTLSVKTFRIYGSAGIRWDF